MKTSLVKIILVICVLLSGVLSSGCASVVGLTNDGTQSIPISSTPSDASITITDDAGSEVFTGKTPITVALLKRDSSYWGKKNYFVEVSKDGYKSQTIPIKASANRWYIFGNVFFGGLVGWLIVDPLYGDMYTLSPEDISASSSDDAAHNNTGEEGSISIVLLQDVPAHLLDKIKRLN